MMDISSKSKQASKRMVAESACAAWTVQGHRIREFKRRINDHISIDSLASLESKTLEFIVDADENDIWESLSASGRYESWKVCVLVPLPLLGVAHERLRQSGCELQGWWSEGNRVHFGSAEIA